EIPGPVPKIRGNAEVRSHDDIRMRIAVQIANGNRKGTWDRGRPNRNRLWSKRRHIVRFGSEGSISVAEKHRHQRRWKAIVISARRDQIEIAVAVQVAHRDSLGVVARGIRHAGAERTVSISEENGYRVREEIRHHEIGPAVLVEVAAGDRGGRAASGEVV